MPANQGNAPDTWSSFVLDEDRGEVKITYTPDTKVANAGNFVINKEDHTLGNLLRMQLLRDPTVRFAGYKIPHPLIHRVELKIQTSSAMVKPGKVLSSAIEDLGNETDHLKKVFEAECERWKRLNGM
jgi:DNA-directed RNA polymerase II subunit RPB11